MKVQIRYKLDFSEKYGKSVAIYHDATRVEYSPSITAPKFLMIVREDEDFYKTEFISLDVIAMYFIEGGLVDE